MGGSSSHGTGTFFSAFARHNNKQRTTGPKAAREQSTPHAVFLFLAGLGSWMLLSCVVWSLSHRTSGFTRKSYAFNAPCDTLGLHRGIAAPLESANYLLETV